MELITRRLIIAATGMLLCIAVLAQTPKNVSYQFTEASDLTLVGKIFPDTPNPYHRVDTVKYKGFTAAENFQVRMSSGIICAFKTNSTVISVQTEYGQTSFPGNTMGISARGYDLYIKNGGEWVYAASGVAKDKALDKNLVLLKDMDGSEHECLLYLPLFSEVHSVKIGVQEGAEISALENPFRHRVAIWGSSYTHGTSTSHGGMTYPAQFSRATGIQLLSLGCSGNCKIQDYFCTALCDVQADAFILDCFSNPDAAMIEARLFPFVERMTAAHPGKPLIFQQTIRREGRNFSTEIEKKEAAKQAMADSLMRIAVKRYKDVYYIHPSVSQNPHDRSVDGIHPDDYGYTLWERSIEKPVLRILKKYGIR